MRRLTTVVVFALLLAGCGGESDSENDGPLPATASSGGLELTFESLETVATVTSIEGEEESAPEGSSYALIKTSGTNNTQEPLDLGCSLQITDVFQLIDSEDSQYNEVFGLEESGPEEGYCNVQPGQPIEKTWIYLIKNDVQPKALKWSFINSEFEEGPEVAIAVS